MAEGLNPPADHDDAYADHLTDTQLNTAASWATRHWTPKEDVCEADYIAVMNTSKKKHGKEQRNDWFAVAKLVPRRTIFQCRYRWRTLDPSFDRTDGRKGK
jgi:hypothetical protein